MSAPISLADILARVASSRRYRWIAEDVVARLAAEEIPKARNLADAEKRTKRRLHQIFGAYAGQPDYARRLLALAGARDSDDHGAIHAACRDAMSDHAATRERLPILDRFYDRIFAITGVPSTLVDIACGLNPLALPWMNLPDGRRYIACDIDTSLVGFVDGFLDLMNVDAQVECRDVVVNPGTHACDVALLLKSVPCLDQQRPDAAQRVLQAIDARSIVVSFPTRSLGGRGKGMEQTYRERFRTLLASLDWTTRRVDEIVFPGEVVFVVR